MRIDLHPRAKREISDSYDWYQARSPRTAERFKEAVRDALEQVRKTPYRYAKHSKETRSAPVWKFPYRIIYSIEPDRLFVVAIAHGKRRENYWIGRLKDKEGS